MGSFAVDLKHFGEKAMKNVQVVSRKIALDLFRRVVLRTPVRTGRARANWQVSIGNAVSGIVEKEDQTGQMAFAAIEKEVLSWDCKDVAIYLTNNLAYIERLEDGYSGQAPAGMVKITLKEYPGIVETSASGAA